MPFVICTLVFGSLALAGHAGYFVFIDRIRWYLRRKAERTQGQLDDVFVRISQERLQRLYLLAPVGFDTVELACHNIPRPIPSTPVFIRCAIAERI